MAFAIALLVVRSMVRVRGQCFAPSPTRARFSDPFFGSSEPSDELVQIANHQIRAGRSQCLVRGDGAVDGDGEAARGFARADVLRSVAHEPCVARRELHLIEHGEDSCGGRLERTVSAPRSPRRTHEFRGRRGEEA